MNILLLRPSTKGYATPPPDTPSGLMYLASTLKFARHGIAFEVTIRDLEFEELGDISEFDGCGITVLSKCRQSAFRLIREVREKKPDIRIVVGGPHASSCPISLSTWQAPERTGPEARKARDLSGTDISIGGQASGSAIYRWIPNSIMQPRNLCGQIPRHSSNGKHRRIRALA